MLTLQEAADLGGFSIYRDVEYAGGVRSVTSRFYALADAPRLAREPSGLPAFQFLRYRQLVTNGAAPAQQQAGGLVIMTLELAPTVAEQPALAAAIAAHYKLDAAKVEILPVLIENGHAVLSFGGDAPPAPGAAAPGATAAPATTPPPPADPDAFGVGSDVACAGTSTICFSMNVSQDGAAILSDAIDRGVAVLFASLALQFEYKLDGISLHVWCDAKRAYDTASSLEATGGTPTPQLLASQLVNAKAAGVEVDTSSQLPAGESDELQALGQKLLADALAAAVIPPDPATGQATIKPLDATADVTLNHTFTMMYPVTAHVTVDGPVAIQLTDDQRKQCVVDDTVAPAAYFIAGTAATSVDFQGGLVSSVHVYLSYDATDLDGSPLHSQTDFVLDAQTARAPFRFGASPNERTYTYRATVTYKDGSTLGLAPQTTSATVLVVDVADLGVLAVDIALGDVPLAQIAHAIVQLTLPATGAQHQLLLDGATPAATWQLVVGANPPGPYQYRVSWLLADGRRVDEPAQSATSRTLFLDAPRDLVAASSVMAIASVDFTQVAQVIVELRASADANADHATLAFTQSGAPQTWTFHPPAGTPQGAPLRYQVKRTVIDRDGTTAAFDFTDETSPILVVRDVSRFDVQIVARLLDLGPTGAYVLALLTLADDDTTPPVQDILTIRDPADEPTWSVHMTPGAPDRHHYRYQLTLVAHDGTRHAGTWMASDEEILVLRNTQGS